MQNILISIKNKSKLQFLLELLKQFDFIEIKKVADKVSGGNEKSFLKTAGIWKDRNFNVENYIRESRKGNRLNGSDEK